MDDETRPDRLGEFLDGSLSDEQRRSFEEELAGDPELAAEAARLEKLTALIEQLPAERDLPAELNVRILDAIATERAAKADRGGVVAGPGSEQRARSIFSAPRLGWAVAAAALLVAALVWYVNRPEPVGPGAVQTARLHLGFRVGAPVAHADYRVYEADLDRIYHASRFSGRRAAISYNNLRVPLDLPYRRVKADAHGNIAFGDSTPSGMRIVSVEIPGHLRQWGLLECATAETPAPPDQPLPPSRLYPAEEHEVRGQVTDATSGKPVSGAMVTSPDGSGVLVSNREGRFEGTLSFVPEGELRLLVCARGYATGILPVDRDGESPAGGFAVKLEPALRYDIEFTIVDEADQPLPGAVVLAVACDESVPDHRSDRPELAIADKQGVVRLWQLRECPYRLEVHHRNADFAPVTLDVTAPPARVTARPAGGAELAIRMVAADGSKLRSAQVMLSHPGEVEGQMLSVAYGGEGAARFRNLEAGATTALVVTGNGVGYELEFEVAPDAALAVPYRLSATPHVVKGGMAPTLARGIVALRLEAELEAVEIGGRRTTGHRVVAEVVVGSDGTFEFPPLPRCRLVKLEGLCGPRKRTKLEAGGNLATGLASAAAGEIRITVSR